MMAYQTLLTARRFVYLAAGLLLLGASACTAATVPIPTPTVASWQTYEHARDRANPCHDERLNFTIDVPPGWITEVASCRHVRFAARGKLGGLEVNIVPLPQYSSSVSAALSQLTQAHRGTHATTDIEGNRWKVEVTHTSMIKLNGSAALRLSSTNRPEAADRHCTMEVVNIIALSPQWSSGDQRGVYVAALRCQDDTSHAPYLDRGLDSFQFVEHQ